MRYPSSCWFLLALILDPSANSSMLLYSFMSSMVAEPSASECWRAVRVPAAAAAERCMELDLKWRRKSKRGGRKAGPAAGEEGSGAGGGGRPGTGRRGRRAGRAEKLREAG